MRISTDKLKGISWATKSEGQSRVLSLFNWVTPACKAPTRSISHRAGCGWWLSLWAAFKSRRQYGATTNRDEKFQHLRRLRHGAKCASRSKRVFRSALPRQESSRAKTLQKIAAFPAADGGGVCLLAALSFVGRLSAPYDRRFGMRGFRGLGVSPAFYRFFARIFDLKLPCHPNKISDLWKMRQYAGLTPFFLFSGQKLLKAH